jgi:hypothetical protein
MQPLRRRTKACSTSRDAASTTPGRRVFIVLEGTMTDTEVRVNGASVGPVHRGGFYRFKHDITDFIRLGEQNDVEIDVSKQRFLCRCLLDEASQRRRRDERRRRFVWHVPASLYPSGRRIPTDHSHAVSARRHFIPSGHSSRMAPVDGGWTDQWLNETRGLWSRACRKRRSCAAILAAP